MVAMRVRGRLIVIPLLFALVAIVGGAGVYSWSTSKVWKAMPDRPDIVRLFEDAAARGAEEVALPDACGHYLFATPYALTPTNLPSELALDASAAEEIVFLIQAESMRAFHIVDGRCVGQCAFDGPFDFAESIMVFESGETVQLHKVDEHGYIRFRLGSLSKDKGLMER